MNKDNELMVMEDNNSSIKLKTENTIPEQVMMDLDVDQAIQDWKDYQRLTVELLDDSDYEITKDGPFKKKSAWQKYRRAFNINTEIVDREYIRDKHNRIFEAEYIVRATLPNGSYVESDGSCDRREPGKANASNHTIKATAKTRATNRAIGELIGAGEVSYEELDSGLKKKPGKRNSGIIDVNNEKKGQVRRRKKAPAQPKKEKEDEEAEVIDAEIIEKPKSENPALVLKGTDNVVLGEWFRKIIQKLERRGDELTKKNFTRISKLWAFDNQYPDFTEDICKNLLEHVEEA